MKTDIAVAAFLNSARARGLSERTISWYYGILYLFIRQYRKLPRRARDCENFIVSCRAGDERRHGYYRALRAFYNFAASRHFLKHNPMEGVGAPRRRKKLPRPLTPEQLDQLLAFPHPARVQAALLFLADSGCRLSELLSLEEQSFIETEWGIVASVTGKTGTRLVPISWATWLAAKQIVPLGLSACYLSRILSRAFREAHVPGSAISLRHTFATLWEGDDHVLQRIMGHADYATTQIYQELRVKLAIEQHAQYSPLRMVRPVPKSLFEI